MIASLKDEAPLVLAVVDATLRTLPDGFHSHKEAAGNALGWLGDYDNAEGLDASVIDSLCGQVIALALHARSRALTRLEQRRQAEEGNGV